MLTLEQIQKNAAIAGIEPGQVVRIVTTEPVGPEALTVYYKTSDGKLLERMLFRTDEASLSLAEAGRPWATRWRMTQASANPSWPGYSSVSC